MITFIVMLLAGIPLLQSTPAPTQLEAQLRRETQEIFDATAAGNRAPFEKYFAADVTFFDEKGRWMTKTDILADVAPLPHGYSGEIKMATLRSHIEANVAIMSYDVDETETIYGQQLHARYHETDTWMLRQAAWQIVAGQVLRYYEDPAPGRANTKKFASYVGDYQLAPGVTMSVSSDGGRLYSQRGSAPKQELIPEAADIFFRKGIEGRRLFRYDEDGKVDALIDRRNNEDVLWKKVGSARNRHS